MHGSSSSDRQLINALKELQRHWEETSSYWQDKARADFDKDFIQELLPVGRTTVSAIGEIARLLESAIQECS